MNTATFSNVSNNTDFSFAIALTTSGGGALDLTNSTLRMQVRSSPLSPVLIFPVTVTVTNVTGGLVTISAPLSVMATVPPGTYSHDMVRLRPDGITEQVWTGTLTVVAGVTR